MGEGQIAAAAQETAMKLLNSDNKVQSSGASDMIAIATNETGAKNDLIRQNEQNNSSLQEVLMKGTNISALYAKTAVRPSIPPGTSLSRVGFSSMEREPSDEEVYKLVDDAIMQVLGPRG